MDAGHQPGNQPGNTPGQLPQRPQQPQQPQREPEREPGNPAASNRARLQRRRRLHELVLALIAQQADLELLDGEALLSATSSSNGPMSSRDPARRDPASWLEHNRRLIQRYQALVRTAATLDALIDQEVGDGPSPSGRQP